MCDLETSRIGAPYIYDISNLRVKFACACHRTSYLKMRERTETFEVSVCVCIRAPFLPQTVQCASFLLMVCGEKNMVFFVVRIIGTCQYTGRTKCRDCSVETGCTYVCIGRWA